MSNFDHLTPTQPTETFAQLNPASAPDHATPPAAHLPIIDDLPSIFAQLDQQGVSMLNAFNDLAFHEAFYASLQHQALNEIIERLFKQLAGTVNLLSDDVFQSPKPRDQEDPSAQQQEIDRFYRHLPIIKRAVEATEKLIGTEPPSYISEIEGDIQNEAQRFRIAWPKLLSRALQQSVHIHSAARVIRKWARIPTQAKILGIPYPGYVDTARVASVIMDISGSIDDQLRLASLAILYKILRAKHISKMNIVFFDTDPRGIYTVTSPKHLKAITRLPDGGGTDMGYALSWISLHFGLQSNVIVVISDGLTPSHPEKGWDNISVEPPCDFIFITHIPEHNVLRPKIPHIFINAALGTFDDARLSLLPHDCSTYSEYYNKNRNIIQNTLRKNRQTLQVPIWTAEDFAKLGHSQ